MAPAVPASPRGGGQGADPSSVAGNGDVVQPPLGTRWGLGCQGQSWFHTNLSGNSVCAPKRGREWRAMPRPSPQRVRAAPSGQGLRLPSAGSAGDARGMAWNSGADPESETQSTSTCLCHIDAEQPSVH